MWWLLGIGYGVGVAAVPFTCAAWEAYCEGAMIRNHFLKLGGSGVYSDVPPAWPFVAVFWPVVVPVWGCIHVCARVCRSSVKRFKVMGHRKWETRRVENERQRLMKEHEAEIDQHLTSAGRS